MAAFTKVLSTGATGLAALFAANAASAQQSQAQTSNPQQSTAVSVAPVTTNSNMSNSTSQNSNANSATGGTGTANISGSGNSQNSNANSATGGQGGAGGQGGQAASAASTQNSNNSSTTVNNQDRMFHAGAFLGATLDVNRALGERTYTGKGCINGFVVHYAMGKVIVGATNMKTMVSHMSRNDAKLISVKPGTSETIEKCREETPENFTQERVIEKTIIRETIKEVPKEIPVFVDSIKEPAPEASPHKRVRSARRPTQQCSAQVCQVTSVKVALLDQRLQTVESKLAASPTKPKAPAQPKPQLKK